MEIVHITGHAYKILHYIATNPVKRNYGRKIETTLNLYGTNWKLKKLVAMGLITKTKAKFDRIHVLALTPKGKEIYLELNRIIKIYESKNKNKVH
jgi:DNA-binding MarR family transcriptional regulator